MQAFNLLTMSTFAERVRLAMEEAGHTQSSLARALGLTRASISFWLNGQTKEISGDNLLKAASALNVSPVWLAAGRGPKRDGSPGLFPEPVVPEMERSSEIGWPFKVSRADYDQLTERDRLILDDLIRSFVASCLRGAAASEHGEEAKQVISGVVGHRRLRAKLAKEA